MDTLNGYISAIIDSLNSKNAVLDQIIVANGKQKDILESAELDLDLFDNNLEEKAALVNKLNSLDDAFTSVYDKVKEALATNKQNYKVQIEQMKALISEITDKSVKIQSEEARNKKLAEQVISNTRKDVGNARKNSSMASNYYKSMSQVDTSPQFFDSHK